MVSFKKEEKKSNNNTDRYNLKQLDLNGNQTSGKILLKGYYKYFLETFYLNKDIAITPTNLYESWSSELGIHENTVKNFIKSACSRGWICELKIIKGTRVSNAYIDIKHPDYLSTGQLVYDKRFKYYKITDLGKQIFEGNDLNTTRIKLK